MFANKARYFVLVDGVWSLWSDWDTCTVTCGGGTQNRMRTCDNPAPANGGANCVGDSTEPSNCNTDGCPGNYEPYIMRCNQNEKK